MKEAKREDASSASPPACPASRGGALVASVLMALVLLATGVALVWIGVQAIQVKSWDLPWHSGGGVAVLPVSLVGFSRSGVEVYRGTAAVRVGIGLSAFGVMLGIWSAALMRGATRTWGWGQVSPASGRRPVSMALTIVSLACLITGTIAFFPPWHIGTSASATALYTEWLLAGIFLGIPPTRERVLRWIIPTVVAASLIAAPFSTGGGFGVIMGFLLAVAAVVHVMMLFSRERTWVVGDVEQ